MHINADASSLKVDEAEAYVTKICASYRTRAIISRGLYNLYPTFHCGLYSKAANIRQFMY